jgi:hypothetical protein
MHRPDGRRRPWCTLVGLSLMASGCYLSHGVEGPDVGPDRPTGCVSDADCADGDRCTTDRCVVGRCTYEPISFSEHAAYRAATGSATSVSSDGARALVLTDALGVEPFDASGPAGAPTRLTPTGGDRDWDSAIATNGAEAIVVTVAETSPVEASVVMQSVTTGTRDARPAARYFVEAAWTGASFISIEHDMMATCTLRELDPVRGFVGDPVRAACPYTSVLPAFLMPPWYVPVRGSRGEVRLLSLGMDGQVVEWTPSRGERALQLVTDRGLGLHSLASREVDGVLGAAWVRVGAGSTTVVAAVLEEDGGRLVPSAAPIERAAPAVEAGGPYAFWMSAAECSRRFVLVAADPTGLYVLELDRRGAAVSEWRSLGPFAQAGRISSACIDGGVVIAEWSAVHVLTCEP